MKKITAIIFLFSLLIFSMTGCKNETSTLPLCTQCQKEKQCITYNVQGQKYLVCSDCYDAFAANMGLTSDASDTVLPCCSECKEQKACRSYDIDGQEYLVCDECYDVFAANIGLIEDVNDTAGSDETSSNEKNDSDTSQEVPSERPNLIPVCSLCEKEKECDTYEVDGASYIVCPDCYNEFAHAFDLIDEETDTSRSPDTTPVETPEDTASSDTPAQLTCSGCEVEKECKIYDIDGVEFIVCDDCYIEFATGMGLME